MSEYVIRGNTAVLKCTIPSFVADFVKVESWLGSDGTEFTPSHNFGTKNKKFICLSYFPLFHILLLIIFSKKFKFSCLSILWS